MTKIHKKRKNKYPLFTNYYLGKHFGMFEDFKKNLKIIEHADFVEFKKYFKFYCYDPRLKCNRYLLKKKHQNTNFYKNFPYMWLLEEIYQ